MAQEPQNPRLWAMYIAQAKSHFRTYPSPAASAWVHQHYTQAGGRFVETSEAQDDKRRATEKRRNEVQRKHGRGRSRKGSDDDKK